MIEMFFTYTFYNDAARRVVIKNSLRVLQR